MNAFAAMQKAGGAGAVIAEGEFASEFAWFKFDEEPANGPTKAIDSGSPVFSELTMANAGDYTTNAGWMIPSAAAKVAASGGCGVMVSSPSVPQRAFVEIYDTVAAAPLPGALIFSWWADIPATAITADHIFSYGNASIDSNGYSFGVAYTAGSSKLSGYWDSGAGPQSHVGAPLSAGEHHLCVLMDVVGNTVYFFIDGLPDNSWSLKTPTGAVAVNRIGFLMLMNGASGANEFGEGDTGDLGISDLKVIRIESDKTSQFPDIIKGLSDPAYKNKISPLLDGV